ncbi:MAG: Spy/CpxP family protein refolding chaperone [Desulfonatronovibrionaceae bacterium]
MKRKHLILGLTVLLAAAMLSSAALAQRHGRGMMRGQNYADTQYRSGDYGPYTGLSEDQIQALQKINEKYRQDLADLQNKMLRKRTELNSLLVQEKVDTSKATSVYRDILDIRADMFELGLKKRSELQDQDLSLPYGQGPGMMGGPGMMQGPGYGPGMMHSPGYGPGMMQGPRYGPGMMQGPGYGPGMMHGGW